MSWVELILLFFLCVPIAAEAVMIFFWMFFKEDPQPSTGTLPKISILIAARNEEENIERCIQSLLLLNYPRHLTEIFIGDDNSSDSTYEVANQLAANSSHIKVLKIKKDLPPQKGKANVLAQLARNASGKYLFFTDADIVVSPNWIMGMLAGFSKNIGLVTGVTSVSGNSWWSNLQRMDWVYALSQLKFLNYFNVSVTAMGNNMAVNSAAYKTVGGYENIPFSTTEDFELLKQIKKAGYEGFQLFNRDVVNITSPEPSLKWLLQQRKRWMHGAVQLPIWLTCFLMFQSLNLFAFFLMASFNMPLAVGILALKIISRSILIFYGCSSIKQKVKVICFFFYEFYHAILSLLLIGFYLLPIPIIWKGRKY